MSKIEIYIRENCSFCRAAKRLLVNKGLIFEEISLDLEPLRGREMLDRTGGRTVPQILIAGKPVGGFEELVEMNEEGGLARLA
jgi:glutaredoxin 3